MKQAGIVWGKAAGEKWSDHIDSMEIHSSGILTLAKLYGTVIEYWDAFVMPGHWSQYEPLLLEE